MVTTRDSVAVGATLAVSAMVSVQIGVVLALTLITAVGVTGAVWLQLCAASVILLAIARPRPSAFNRRSFILCVLLGLVFAAMSLCQLLAVSRIALGTAMALFFLGPLGLSVMRNTGRTLLWPPIAAVGVVLLTQPWSGSVDAVGISAALVAAVCWAAYIVLTQRAGDVVHGINALAVSVPAAALAAGAVAAPSVTHRTTWHAVVLALAVAVLMPVIPCVLEFLALRRLSAGAFGMLMSLDPAIALVVGIVLLHQVPDALELAGIFFVVGAGWGATRAHTASGRPSTKSGS